MEEEISTKGSTDFEEILILTRQIQFSTEDLKESEYI